MENLLFVGGAVGVLGVLATVVAMTLRRVVSTNEVHIVQSAKKTTSYGKDTTNGNVYYAWPSNLPLLGITKVVLPTSVFSLNLKNYEAYDLGRLPFVVDIMAFFRINDSNVAAQRVSNFSDLNAQLLAIVQGAVRTILAGSTIEEIMQGRSKFGKEFTDQVEGQLKSWGVSTVKSIELMDIRDHEKSVVIHNIMEKKKSHIEMESRSEVAKNMQKAQQAEIDAEREVNLQKQEAAQQVGLRTIEAQRQVELQNQAKSQAVKEQELTTKQKEMAVLQVQHVRSAEINRDVEVVKAEQVKRASVIQAEGEKQQLVLRAEGSLEAKKRESEGVTLAGAASASAVKAMQLASIEGQVSLAKEVGTNENYQKYLVTIRQIEANQAIGVEQAKALTEAEIKVIANTGNNVGSGLTSVMDLFSAKGGTELGAALEALANTDTGKAVMDKVLNKDVRVVTGKGA